MHLKVLQQSPDPLDRGDDGGHDHHRACHLGNADAQVEPRQQHRPDEPVDDTVHERHRQLAGGDEREQPRPESHPGWRLRRRHRDHRRRHAEPRDRRDRAEIDRGAVLGDYFLQALPEPRVVRDVVLELPPAASDQVVADVRGPRVAAFLLRRLARALDGAQRDRT